MKHYFGSIVKLLTIILLVGTIYHQRVEINELKHKELGDNTTAPTIDSLQNELFIQHTIVDRYDITLERLRETNPTAAEQFEELYRQSE